MKDSYFKKVLETLAEKIDRLETEVYVKNLQHNEMELAMAEREKELLMVKEENKTLREALDTLKKVIVEEIEDELL